MYLELSLLLGYRLALLNACKTDYEALDKPPFYEVVSDCCHGARLITDHFTDKTKPPVPLDIIATHMGEWLHDSGLKSEAMFKDELLDYIWSSS